MSDDSNFELPGVRSLDPDRLERAMRCLPYIEREALLLTSRGEMTYAEIGAVLGLTPAQAEARVAAALVELHARMMQPERRWPRIWPFGQRPGD